MKKYKKILLVKQKFLAANVFFHELNCAVFLQYIKTLPVCVDLTSPL